MAKAKDTGITYNKELVEQGVELLTKCRSDLFDADCLMYDAVIGITGAKGFNLVDAAAGGIDINLPEQRVVGLREKTEHLIETITEAGRAIVSYSTKKDSTLKEKLKVLFDEKNVGAVIGGTIISGSVPQVVYGPPTRITGEVSFEKGGQALYAPPKATIKKGTPIKKEKINEKSIQALYAPPPQRIKKEPIQALYAAPPTQEPIVGKEPIQALYAAPPTQEPIVVKPPIQALYAAPPVQEPIVVKPPIQALYAAPPTQEPIVVKPPIQALYAAPPTQEPIVVKPPIQALYAAPPTQEPIVVKPPIQALYAAPPTQEPIVVKPPIQALYAAPPTQKIQKIEMPSTSPETVVIANQAIYAPPSTRGYGYGSSSSDDSGE